MKKIMLILFVGLFTCVSTQAKYVTPLNGPGVKITRYFAHNSGALTLYISGPLQNLDQCNTTYRVHIPHDAPGREVMVSAALAAFVAGKKMGFHASGCGTTSFWGSNGGEVPIIDNLWVF